MSATRPPTAKRDLALRSIVAYKTAKAAAQLGLATLVLMLMPFGLPGWLALLTLKLRHRIVQGLSVRIVDALAWGTRPGRLELTVAALVLDGLLTATEAWALKREKWWAPWLVVLVTAALLPFEVLEWYRHPHALRALMFAANLAIVGYLVHRAWVERRASHARAA